MYSKEGVSSSSGRDLSFCSNSAWEARIFSASTR